MTYPNAYKGVTKLFIAELIGLFATLAIGVLNCLVPVGESVTANDSVKTLMVAAMGLSLAAGVFVTVFEIVGIRQASFDEAALGSRSFFKPALIAAIASISANIILASAFSGSPVISSCASCLLWILVSVFVMLGIMNFANAFNDAETALTCRRTAVLTALFQAVSMAVIVLPEFVSFEGVSPVMLTAASVLFSVIAIALLLRCLFKGKRMLAEN